MSVTLQPLVPTAVPFPWGTEVLYPSPDQVLLEAAEQALANKTPMPDPKTFLYTPPWSTTPQVGQYSPFTLILVANLAAIAAAG
jgi:hypothetical protein